LHVAGEWNRPRPPFPAAFLWRRTQLADILLLAYIRRRRSGLLGRS